MTTTTTIPDTVDIAEAARMLQVSPLMISYWIGRGELTDTVHDGEHHIVVADIAALRRRLAEERAVVV